MTGEKLCHDSRSGADRIPGAPPLAMTLPSPQAWFLELIRCPACSLPLERRDSRGRCPACGSTTDLAVRPIDLTHRALPPLQASLPRSFRADAELRGVRLDSPPIHSPPVPGARDSRALFAALEPLAAPPGDLLDLGCGPRDQAAIATAAGFRYVGVDLFDEHAEVRADAHALPFAGHAFDVVLAYAVLEHLHNPLVALAEIHRVLRPGGSFVGTVSQGEPFHASYFHWTPWGLQAAASWAGFRIERLWPSRDTLAALTEMGRYSRPVRAALALLDRIERRLPFLAPRRWRRWSEREKQLDTLLRAGSLCFHLRSDRSSTG